MARLPADTRMRVKIDRAGIGGAAVEARHHDQHAERRARGGQPRALNVRLRRSPPRAPPGGRHPPDSWGAVAVGIGRRPHADDGEV